MYETFNVKFQPQIKEKTSTTYPRHIVEVDRETNEYKDQALCGELWDRLHPGHNGSICQNCVEIQKVTPRT